MPITDRVHGDIGVSPQARGVILDGQVRRDCVVTAPAQFCLDQVPVPADVAGSVDECECHHDRRNLRSSDVTAVMPGGPMSSIEDAETPSTADPAPRGAGLIRSIAHRLSGDTAALPFEGRLASFDGATSWLNSDALTPAALRGRVVLVDFWTYTCVN